LCGFTEKLMCGHHYSIHPYSLAIQNIVTGEWVHVRVEDIT